MALAPLPQFTTFPLILAGPILRRVSPTAVSVWLALKSSATVKLTLYNGTAMVKDGTATSHQIGANLHVVLVTVSPSALSEGVVYSYDLTFTTQTGAIALADAAGPTGITPAFGYGSDPRPSFALPPTDPTKLRLMHGSCRKPHGEGDDALAILDVVISQSVTDAMKRPHQLLLTGDQIYADDVADGLLLLLTDAGDKLMGWPEDLPPPATPGSSLSAAKLPSYSREDPLKKAGFTSDDLRSHLMSLGEYFAMYLFAWSNVLWPKTPLPTFLEIMNVSFPGADASDDGVGAGAGAVKVPTAVMKRKSIIVDDTANVEVFRKTLPFVRRALANVPSYMICDDHEFTDDWNMTREFCEKVYGSPLGLRIAQNALVAFSICQAWGNTPEQFDQQPPFPKMLQLVAQPVANLATAASVYASNSDAIRKIVAVHNAGELATNQVTTGLYRAYHDGPSDALRYNFTIEGPGHQVIVTDTRTWRAFPDPGKKVHAHLLDPGELQNQIGNAPKLNNRVLLVVFTTNAPPIASIREAAKHTTILDVYGDDLFDSWEFPSLPFDRMIAEIATLFTPSGGVTNGQFVLLSGDVHHSFSSRLDYEARERLGDTAGNTHPTNLVVGQLVASSLKNETDKTRGLQKDGYRYVPDKFGACTLVPDFDPEGYAGWNWTQHGKKMVGLPQIPYSIDADGPTLPVELSKVVALNGKPDYRYRLEYLVCTDTGQGVPPPPSIGPVFGESASDRTNTAKACSLSGKALRDFHNAQAAHPDIVGHSNIGEITFQWSATDKRVLHTLRWQDKNKALWARYDVSLNINDPKYPAIKGIRP